VGRIVLVAAVGVSGYLQRQFRAATGSMVAAVALQGLDYGLMHVYQGWKHVAVIMVLGIFDGVLVAWRRNLRARACSERYF
jgi:hypothetical protein